MIYSRGGDSVQLVVIAGRTPTTVEDSDTRVRLKSYVRDYLILPEDLTFDEGDTTFFPKAGDEIVDGDATYEVVAIQSGEPAWVWHDQEKEVIRVHTQLSAGT